MEDVLLQLRAALAARGHTCSSQVIPTQIKSTLSIRRHCRKPQSDDRGQGPGIAGNGIFKSHLHSGPESGG